MSDQKKLITAFKTFVEKVFLPSAKRNQSQLNQWNKFSQQLNSERVNYEALAYYIENINISQPQPAFTNSFEKRQLPPFKKRNQEGNGINGQTGGFNPSKTFGGQRARMNFGKPEIDDSGDRQNNHFGSNGKNEDKGGRGFQTSPQLILPGLEKMCKMFTQNHQRIENMVGGKM